MQDLRIMGDLGAFNFVQHFDMERWSEKQIKELIFHSNVVYNVIGSWRGNDELFYIKLKKTIELNTWPRRVVNVEWPERLAQMVAEKGDGTRLVHLVHLNAGDEESMKHSAILREQAEAIERMRNIYPETVVVKVSSE